MVDRECSRMVEWVNGEISFLFFLSMVDNKKRLQIIHIDLSMQPELVRTGSDETDSQYFLRFIPRDIDFTRFLLNPLLIPYFKAKHH